MKRFLCALLCALLLAGALPAAQAAGLRASIATGKVTINGQIIDNSTAQYPLLVYKDITYVPMTFYLCRFLGLETGYDGPSRSLFIYRTGGTGSYVPDSGHKAQKGSVTVTQVDYPVFVNDEEIDNGKTQWPLLNYSGVTYFPLTWAFAVDSFGWDYRWDAENGLRIDSTGADPYVAQPIVNPANPPISTGDWTDGEAMNAASRGWGPAASGSCPENLTVEVTGEWTLEAIKEAIGKGLDTYMKEAGSKLAGRLTEVEIPYSFQLPPIMRAGDVLHVPYTATYQGDEVPLPSGKTFTPYSTSEEAYASVRLGQGQPGKTDPELQERQELYQKLAACAQIPTLTAVSGSEGFYDASEAIQEAVNANLKAAGLPYMISFFSSGSYVNPYWTQPGYSQTLEFRAGFAPTDESAPADPLFEVSAQCTLLTVEK